MRFLVKYIYRDLLTDVAMHSMTMEGGKGGI